MMILQAHELLHAFASSCCHMALAAYSQVWPSPSATTGSIITSPVRGHLILGGRSLVVLPGPANVLSGCFGLSLIYSKLVGSNARSSGLELQRLDRSSAVRLGSSCSNFIFASYDPAGVSAGATACNWYASCQRHSRHRRLMCSTLLVLLKTSRSQFTGRSSECPIWASRPRTGASGYKPRHRRLIASKLS